MPGFSSKPAEVESMRKFNTSLIILAFALVSLTGFAARSGELVASFGKEKPVTLEDFRPHLEDVEGYTEQWNYTVHLPDGTFLAADFGVSNMAVTSDHDGGFRAKHVDPQKKKTKCQVELDDDEWKYGKTGGFWLDFKKGKVKSDMKGSDVTVRCKKLKMDLHFENLAPPFKPGGGVLRFGDKDGIYKAVFISPRARVTGKVTVAGKTREIEGVGHAMHTHTNMRADKQVRRWFSFKRIDKDVTIVLTEMESTKKYYDSRNGWALVYDAQGRHLATARVRFDYDGFIKDQQSKEGYRIPRRVRFAAVDGKNQMAGVLTMEKLLKAVDPTEEMGAVKRALYRQYSKPKTYHIGCKYKFNLKTGEGSRIIEGEGKYRFMYVNP
jgi:predicted secreted hydrolase